jgi:hypothetical protein
MASFLLLCSMLSGTSSLAATVTWSGAGGDNLWSNPANWTGGALPTSADDVVIDVPGETTVRMDAPNTTVRSLQCEEGFTIENGPFTLTGGDSVVNGEFGMSAAQFGGHTMFEVKGPGTTFMASGAVTNLVGLQATDGAVLNFPALRQMAPTTSSWYTDWSATGKGSAILFPSLTNMISLSLSLNIRAYSGAEIDLRALRSTQPRVGFSASGSNSLVNLSGLSGLLSGRSIYEIISLSADNGGTVYIPNVTALNFVHVNVGSLGTIPTAQLRSFTGGSLSISSGTNRFEGLTNFSGTVTAYDSRLDWTNVTVLPATDLDLRLTAHNSVINISGATNVVMNPSYRLYLTAQSGGRIDLRGLRQPDGVITIETRLGAGHVDLSGFIGLWKGKNSSVRVEDGGSVLIPKITAMDKVSLTVSRDSVVPTEQLRSFTDGNISLYGRTNGFVGLTNFTGYLYVTDTRLDLTNFTVLYATNNQMYFQAEQGSFIDLSRVTNVIGNGLNAFARGGSRIDLSGLRVPEGPVYASAYDAGSVVDISGFNGLWRGSGGITAEAGGTVLMPNVTALDGVSLNVNADANIDLAQLNSITAGTVTLRKRTNDLTALTNFSGQLTAFDSRLCLTNLNVLYVSNYTTIQAEQGSVIDLSRITNVVRGSPSFVLNLNAYDSTIDLSGLRVPDSGHLRVDARGPDALVDFSGFRGLWDATGYVSLTASSGATVEIPDITETRGVSFYLSGDSKVPVAQLRSFNEGSIRLTTQTNVFDGLTKFTGRVDSSYQGRAEFPGLTQLSATNYSVVFSAASGGVVDLWHVTNASAKPYSLALSALDGGRIEIRNLETIVAGQVDVRADGTDAVVDLRGLTGFFSDNNASSLRTTSGGVILLNSDAMLLAGVAIDFQGNAVGVVPQFLAPSQSLVLYGQPWQSYHIESRDPSVADSPWSLYRRVPLTEPLQTVSARAPKDLALRVHAFIADPPEVDIRLSAPSTVAPVLFGVPGRTYLLETRTALGPGGWQDGSTVTLTNSFFILPSAAATNTARFYQSRQL